MHFSHIENFAYGEINERSFSNPHPDRQMSSSDSNKNEGA